MESNALPVEQYDHDHGQPAFAIGMYHTVIPLMLPLQTDADEKGAL